MRVASENPAPARVASAARRTGEPFANLPLIAVAFGLLCWALDLVALAQA